MIELHFRNPEGHQVTFNTSKNWMFYSPVNLPLPLRGEKKILYHIAYFLMYPTCNDEKEKT